jgi:hypothetical protein
LGQGSKDADHTVKPRQPVNGIPAQTHLKVMETVGCQHKWDRKLNEGGPYKHSAEDMRDHVFSAGQVIFGVVTNDSYHYSDF